MRRKINLGILIVSASIITYFSLKPAGTAPGSGSVNFTFLHFLAYFMLAGAFLLHFHDSRIGHFHAAITAFLFGLLMELLQTQVPGRFFSFKDIAVNLAGASLVMLDHRSRLVTDFIEIEDQLIERMIA